jgi:hypothetical protein
MSDETVFLTWRDPDEYAALFAREQARLRANPPPEPRPTAAQRMYPNLRSVDRREK